MTKNILYSCVSGGYDDKQPDRIYIDPSDIFKTHRMNAKVCKTLSHKFFPDADYTIWADSNLMFKINPESLVEYFNYPLVGVFAHNERETINQEIEACKKLKLDDTAKLDYHKNKSGRLCCCFLIIRKNCQEVNILNEEWWSELCCGSSRDQLSFPYTLGKIATIKEVPNKSWNNNSFWIKTNHAKKINYYE